MTKADITEPLQAHPLYIRLPKNGTKDPYFGMTRSWWNSMILPTQENGFTPGIKSILDRKPGNIRGIRLISFESALQYFRIIEETQFADRQSDESK